MVKHNSQDYLLAIWELCESYESANEKAVAERLGISLPSAWEGIHRLERERQLTVSKQGLQFTRDGYSSAMNVVRAHRITEYFAYSYLEVPWDEVHNSVMDLEHDFNEMLLTNLYRKMGSPDYCPHGNPIKPDRRMAEISAWDAADGMYYFVRPVLEEYGFLKKLLNAGSTPGKPVGIERGGSSIYLIGESSELRLPKEMERTIRLKPRSRTPGSRSKSGPSRVSSTIRERISFPLNFNESHA